MSDEMSARERVRRKAISEVLLHFPLRFAEPFIIGTHPNEVPKEDVRVCCATATCLELNEKRFLVTNHHVLRIYRAEREKRTHVRAWVGSTPINNLESRTAEDPESDLAIIEITDIKHERNNDGQFVPLQFHRPRRWPPSDIFADDVLIIAGYPDMGLSRKDDELTHRSFSMAGIPVTGDGYGKFSCKLDRVGWEVAFGELRKEEEKQLLNGMSGSPVFVDRGRMGDLAPELVGFVEEYYEPGDLLIITAATNIRSDGTLKH